MQIVITADVFRACQLAAAKKDCREYLNYVCIEPRQKMLVATDGHVMAEGPIHRIDWANGEELPDQLLVMLDKVIPTSWDYVILDAATKRATGKNPKTQNVGFRIYDGSMNYPDWRRISVHQGSAFKKSSNGDRYAEIGLNAGILSRVIGNRPAKLEFPSEPLAALRVTPQGTDVRVTFMPARV